MSAERLERLYRELLGLHGPQGWWPIPSMAGRPGFDERGYHPGEFQALQKDRSRFEVVTGAVLTQNTAWTNAEKALGELRSRRIQTPAQVRATETGRLASLIRSSGYHNQKARKLQIVASRFVGRGALKEQHAPSREELLGLWGVGPETADAILLYAFRKPVFVIDAYTRRLLGRMGLLAGNEGYDAVQALFHSSLPLDHVLFNEYHALIVQHAKVACRARPLCGECPISGCASRNPGT